MDCNDRKSSTLKLVVLASRRGLQQQLKETDEFFYAELSDNGLHYGLNAAPVQGQVDQVGVFRASFPAWKEKSGMLVNGPKLSQHPQGFARQRHQTVLVALCITDMDLQVVCVDAADCTRA